MIPSSWTLPIYVKYMSTVPHVWHIVPVKALVDRALLSEKSLESSIQNTVDSLKGSCWLIPLSRQFWNPLIENPFGRAPMLETWMGCLCLIFTNTESHIGWAMMKNGEHAIDKINWFRPSTQSSGSLWSHWYCYRNSGFCRVTHGGPGIAQLSLRLQNKRDRSWFLFYTIISWSRYWLNLSFILLRNNSL